MTYSYNRSSTEITKEPVTGDDSENSALRKDGRSRCLGGDRTQRADITAIHPAGAWGLNSARTGGRLLSCTWVGMKSTPAVRFKTSAPHSTDEVPNLNTTRTSRLAEDGERRTEGGETQTTARDPTGSDHTSVGKHGASTHRHLSPGRAGRSRENREAGLLLLLQKNLARLGGGSGVSPVPPCPPITAPNSPCP